jgi:hypothetical protein
MSPYKRGDIMSDTMRHGAAAADISANGLRKVKVDGDVPGVALASEAIQNVGRGVVQIDVLIFRLQRDTFRQRIFEARTNSVAPAGSEVVSENGIGRNKRQDVAGRYRFNLQKGHAAGGAAASKLYRSGHSRTEPLPQPMLEKDVAAAAA